MSLVFFMFQSILNISEHLKKLIIFTDLGVSPPPFKENFAKMINLIFEPFPKRLIFLELLQNIHLDSQEIKV